MKELLIVLPVINERENLKKMIPALLKYVEGRGGILCIDDNSTDGTDKMFADLMKKNNNVHYIRNPRKVGLGNAYKMAADFAIKNGYTWMQQMDADLSHRIEDLKEFDKVTGSSDLILSKGGSLYAKTILGCSVNDLTGGFNRTRTEVFKNIGFNEIKSNGYSFQIELKYRAHKKGYRIKEVPITFSDRTAGQTKMNRSIVLEAIWKVWWMRAVV
jgi:dolichol-phosphate mannosyltransferase